MNAKLNLLRRLVALFGVDYVALQTLRGRSVVRRVFWIGDYPFSKGLFKGDIGIRLFPNGIVKGPVSLVVNSWWPMTPRVKRYHEIEIVTCGVLKR